MTTTLAIEKEIASFQGIYQHLGLTRAPEDDFFPEWQDLAVAPIATNKTFLDRLRKS